MWVKNTSAVTQTVTIDLAFANFGIGLPFTPIGARTITIPPGREAKVCLNWIPPEVGHWCLQAVLHQANFPVQISQRNIDIWETLLPGVPALTEFLVSNPLTEPVPYSSGAQAQSHATGLGDEPVPDRCCVAAGATAVGHAGRDAAPRREAGHARCDRRCRSDRP